MPDTIVRQECRTSYLDAAKLDFSAQPICVAEYFLHFPERFLELRKYVAECWSYFALRKHQMSSLRKWKKVVTAVVRGYFES